MAESDLSNLGELLDVAAVALIIRSFGSVSVIYGSRGTETLRGWAGAEVLGPHRDGGRECETPLGWTVGEPKLRPELG